MTGMSGMGAATASRMANQGGLQSSQPSFMNTIGEFFSGGTSPGDPDFLKELLANIRFSYSSPKFGLKVGQSKEEQILEELLGKQGKEKESPMKKRSIVVTQMKPSAFTIPQGIGGLSGMGRNPLGSPSFGGSPGMLPQR